VTRVAVITGAGQGIGAATVTAFRDRGWTVVGIDREWRDDSDLERIILDLRDFDALQHAISELGHLDALINNAGTTLDADIADLDPAALGEVLTVNLKAAMLALSAAVPALERASGCAVNVASVHGVASRAGVSAYAASKGALLAFTRAAAVELGPLGIRVNAVVPGAVDTAMLAPGIGGERDAALTAVAERTPLRRVGTPAEIARAIRFLADPEESSFVTGHSLTVDGGALARLATE
jgi:NAD(P)-dependent dehydrogenase (short-subunit alcohol dehydrogenase family)